MDSGNVPHALYNSSSVMWGSIKMDSFSQEPHHSLCYYRPMRQPSKSQTKRMAAWGKQFTYQQYRTATAPSRHWQDKCNTSLLMEDPMRI
eukprot:13197129-Ditylum_brightwellii.AAC.1